MFRKYFGLLLALAALTGCAQDSESAGTFPWWGWLILILGLLAILYLIFFWEPKKEKESASPESMPTADIEKTAPETEKPSIMDDLTKIEGIGPKIQAILQGEGISSFSKLAESTPDRITEILNKSGIRLASADTWPEQARLAAEGKLEELQDLQDSLKGGRKVA
jgi:predicted flap endonuclease-1-like 5' DNA nuclease